MHNQNLDVFNSRLRSIFWPIHSHELKKFVPMAALMFCVLFNQNVLRILKDSILISEVSAEITSFTKLYVITPMAAIFVIVYAKMLNHLTFHRIFYYLIATFTIFYVLFAFTIYPNIDFFHMDRERLAHLIAKYPHFKWYISLVANWSYVVFYSFSELWPNVFYILIFWQIANEITATSEAKRFYTLFSLFGNSSLMIVGLLMANLSSDHSFVHNLFTVSDSKIILTQVSTAMVAISSVVSCLLVRYIVKNVMNDRESYKKMKTEKKAKVKMGLIESFRYISRSRYLWLMLICSASFGLSINLVEAVWKSKIKELYPTVSEYAAFNSIYIFWTGIAIILMTFVGNNVIRRHSWFAAAIISPAIIFITGTVFFFLVVFDDKIANLFDGIIIISPLLLSVVVGAIQNILSKGAKYAIWDTTSQMLYIPLDQELRTKGKAAVDVISPKIGKSASGLVQSIIFTVFPMATYQGIAPVLMIVFIIVCSSWIHAVRKIYLEYQKIV